MRSRPEIRACGAPPRSARSLLGYAGDLRGRAVVARARPRRHVLADVPRHLPDTPASYRLRVNSRALVRTNRGRARSQSTRGTRARLVAGRLRPAVLVRFVTAVCHLLGAVSSAFDCLAGRTISSIRAPCRAKGSTISERATRSSSRWETGRRGRERRRCGGRRRGRAIA